MIKEASAAEFSPSGDTFLDTYNPDQNYGGSSTINVEGGSGMPAKQRALLRFDLSSIPSSKFVTKATLKMYATGYWDSSGRTLTVYQVTENWDESRPRGIVDSRALVGLELTLLVVEARGLRRALSHSQL